MVFALIGNQNCGKTTLFNQLTGSNQHVGNFPGVTVEKKEGVIKKAQSATVVDLPGIYSLSPYTAEEVVTRDFLIKEKPDAIINIVDATNIERKLEQALGIPVVPISASKNEGVSELVDRAVKTAQAQIRPQKMDFCSGEVHRAIHGVAHLIEDHCTATGTPLRFAATRLVEGDELTEQALKLNQNEIETLEHIAKEMEDALGTDREAALADMRYQFIEKISADTVHKPGETREQQRSIAIDRVLTHKYFAIPIFLCIMGVVFWLTFGVIGSFLSDVMAVGIQTVTVWTDTLLTHWGINPMVHSLIIDGIYAGVGSVLSFLPIIVVLFFFLSMLEDSGYMARVAFVMDKLLRKIGLSGRSFVPMLIGFGCSVPAIMATRTLASERDRKMTIMLTPFMSCSAKLPIYAVFTAAFFPEHAALVMIALYVLGMVVGILYGLVLKRFCFKGEPVPFVMELPAYRLPSGKSILLHMWEKAKDFLHKAFTIIFVATIVIWFLQSFDFKLNMVADSANSMLAAIGALIAPVFAPLGFGNWKVSTALLTGLTAKEAVVSTLAVLMGVGDSAALTPLLSQMFTPLTAFVFLCFTLLYMPCVAALAAVRREMGSGKDAALAMLAQTGIAWLVAFVVLRIGLLFGLV